MKWDSEKRSASSSERPSFHFLDPSQTCEDEEQLLKERFKIPLTSYDYLPKYTPHYAERSITNWFVRLCFLLGKRSVMWIVAARRRLLGMRRGKRHQRPALAHSHQRRDASATQVIQGPCCWRSRSIAYSAACWKGERKSLMRNSDFL